MSLNAATIEFLLSKGLSGDDLLEVARRSEMRSDPTAAQRKRRQREREKSQRDVTRDTVPPKDIYQTPSETLSNSNELDVPGTENENGLTIDQLREGWNLVAVPRGAVECRRMGPDRRKKANTFIRNYPVDDITEAIHAVAKSDFLCGRGKDEFRADIDFLFSPKHMNRLLEGFYE